MDLITCIQKQVAILKEHLEPNSSNKVKNAFSSIEQCVNELIEQYSNDNQTGNTPNDSNNIKNNSDDIESSQNEQSVIQSIKLLPDSEQPTKNLDFIENNNEAFLNPVCCIFFCVAVFCYGVAF